MERRELRLEGSQAGWSGLLAAVVENEHFDAGLESNRLDDFGHILICKLCST